MTTVQGATMLSLECGAFDTVTTSCKGPLKSQRRPKPYHAPIKTYCLSLNHHFGGCCKCKYRKCVDKLCVRTACSKLPQPSG